MGEGAAIPGECDHKRKQRQGLFGDTAFTNGLDDHYFECIICRFRFMSRKHPGYNRQGNKHRDFAEVWYKSIGL